MSSTNRNGKQRALADFYVTPPYIVDRLLDYWDVHEPISGYRGLQRWYEPTAGDGQIIRTVNARGIDRMWYAGELRDEMQSHLLPLVGDDPSRLAIGDFLQLDNQHFGSQLFDVSITNPPFSLAWECVMKSMEMSKRTAMLLRLSFWESEERAKFMSEFPPDTLVLPNRAVFSVNKHGKPGTDSCAYAWCVWHHVDEYAPSKEPPTGRIRVLGTTPKSVRLEWSRHVKEEADKLLSSAVSGAGEDAEEADETLEPLSEQDKVSAG